MLLDDGGRDAFRAVHAYRDESSFLKVLKFVVLEPEHRLVPDALRLMSGTHFTKCSDTYLSELEQALRQAWELKGGFETQTVKLLAIVIAALPRLIPSGRFNSQLGAILEKFSEHSDPRVAANAIEAMQEFRDTGFASLNRKLLKSENVRIAANAIVFLGKIEVTKQVVKEIGNLLDSGDLVKVGAGIYVWGEVAGFHLQRDAVHLRTQTDFMGLEKRVKTAAAKHPSVRRLAEEAARKASGVDALTAVA
jgi:hypothetical protein